MLIIRKLHRLDRLDFISKIGKYVAEIEFHHFGKHTVWLSEKQAANLERCLDGDVYSTKKNAVFVVIDTENKPRYVWAGCNHAGYLNLKERFNVPDEAADEDEEEDDE